MMKRAPDWGLYCSFLAVLREGSLSGAARALATTQPTVGRHIEELEATLGIALFTRSPQGLTPTAAALDLRPSAEAMASAADALLRAASGEFQGERGTVRLTASEVVGGEILPGLLADFRERHPGIVIELVLSNRAEDLLRRDADLAVRMVRPTQSSLVGKLLGRVPIGLYAHKNYVGRHGMPRTMAELRAHSIIGFDQDASNARIAARAGFDLRREFFAFRCDSDLAQLAALRAGIGIGGCQAGLARRSPDLVPVMAEEIRMELEMWLVTHEDLRTSRRVRLLFDHLAEGLGTYLASCR